GDASDVRFAGTTLADRIIAAAGGGGAGDGGSETGGKGGDGGGLTGGNGTYANVNSGFGLAGYGATQTAGGQCGASGAGPENDGILGIGGSAAGLGGGGGGGGYYGGGGGGSGAGGGGGSALLGSSLVEPSTLSGQRAGDGLIVITRTNHPPNAPALSFPTGNQSVPSDNTSRFTWQFSDPDVGDHQSAYSLRYRPIGAATWTTISVQLPNSFHDFTAGTFVDATNYEWQVATTDAQGLVGPFAASEFFTAHVTPPGPTITAPINGATVPQTVTVTWSTPNQDSWQVQILDDAGAVVQDTGETVGAARSTDVTFAVNNVTRVIQQRSKYQGLWSPWASVTVMVSYTPPPTPTVTLSPDNAAGATVLAIDNPPPGAGEPSVSYVDVYCRTAAGSVLADAYRPYSEAGVRLATWQPPGSLWSDPVPASSPVVYEYRVVAVGSNGTTAASAWVSTATSEPGTARAGTYGGY
ncbi:MAG TPA: glycine-rich protein, partial [Segeticoccus sp.]|nr:glycine-rich protein [Segeticoccus sp.]